MGSNTKPKTTLAQGRPDILTIWDYENNMVRPEDVALYSGLKANWVCEKGHKWEAIIKNVVRGSRCPYCSGRKLISGLNDLATVNPSLAEEWHPTKNGSLKPCDVSSNAHDKVWWLGKCGHEWEARIYSRNKGNGCPICAGLLIIPGINDLKTINPELAREYSLDNPIPADRISPYSHKYVMWNYPCGHSHFAQVKSRHIRKDGCKYCNAGYVLPGENDLQTLYPELVKEWDYERNDKGPDQFRPKSNVRVYWKCSYCGRSFKKSPYDRLKSGCPFCGKEARVSIGEKIIAYYLEKAGFNVIESYRDKEKLGKMELDIYLPELRLGIEYDGRKYHADSNRDYEKNSLCKRLGINLIRFREKGCPAMLGVESIEVNPNDYDTVADGVIKLLSLISKEYNVNVSVETDLKNDFLSIVEKKYTARKEVSIGLKYPETAKNLHPDVKIKPDAIPSKSNIVFKWVCPDCGYVWSAAVSSVVHSFENFRRTGCPRCAGKVTVKGKNDATTIDPVAMGCWDTEHNPDQLSDHKMGDTDVRSWICVRCGKLFRRQINVMCREGSTHACEPCSKIIASSNRFKKNAESGNNLLKLFPEVAKYWDYSLNIDRPEDYTPNSEKEKNWICSICGKSYKSRIIVRTRDGGNTLCSVCGKKKRVDKFKVQNLKDGENTLACKYPELAKEWHPTLNGNLKPTDIPPNYHEKVWWYCDRCKQAWDREPMVRIRGDKGCPICSGRRFCKGINDVATICPAIIPAWHPTLNGDRKPEEYRYRDVTVVYWQCTECGRVTKGSIYNKVKSGSSLCKGCKIKETKKK